MIDFGRELCGDLAVSGRREWLVTNGIGGYASGTVAGPLTRRYHGLLIAALKPPLGRTLLLSKLDETVSYGGNHYPLFANRWIAPHIPDQFRREWAGVEPNGYHHLERFRLEGTTPVWTFACADASLEKRIWMQPGANTTYVRYDLHRATAPLTLSIKALVNYRNHHSNTHANGWQMQITAVEHGLRVTAFDGATPFYVHSDRAEVTPHHGWYRSYYLGTEAYRGLDALEDNLYAGHFQATLQPGQSLTLVSSTEATPDLDSTSAYAERQEYEHELLVGAGLRPALSVGTDASVGAGFPQRGPTGKPVVGAGLKPAPTDGVQQLILAADQFIVRRATPDSAPPAAGGEERQGRTVIAGYPWFGDWGRDTMISLPGLTLVTGRHQVASSILRTFAHFVDEGMLPNRFPDEGQIPEYNTVDATLWYFEAVRAYYAATGDESLLRDLFPVLCDIIERHRRGTRYQIQLDPSDGLLHAGEPGVQLTWMDAKVGDWVVTPRIGKPVEINALWYNALRIMANLARHLGKPPDLYSRLADQAQSGFARFWNKEKDYCYDVLDGPDGDDPTLRPNQLFAVSLPHGPLTQEQGRAVVDACACHLLTSHGLRSLSPDDPAYVGQYGGGQRGRDGAYHQGTVWSWLIGPYVSAHLRVYGDAEVARSFLQPLFLHLGDHGLGSVSEIFDGDPPFAPRGCIAQAWGVAELLRAWRETEEAERAGSADP